MLTFQEIGGSPKEQYSFDTFTATREFLVPWETRDEFVRLVFGSTSEPGRIRYPGRTDVFAWRLRFEPFDPAAVNIGRLENLQTDSAQYIGSFGKAIVDYRMEDSSDRSDGPITEAGTSITYRMVIDAIEETVPSNGWTWQNSNTLIPQDTTLIKRIPVTMHLLTWNNVVSPPWKSISAMQGTVNRNEFQGCAAGTLLFEGGGANKLFRKNASLAEGPSAYVWAINYTFREKSIKFADNVYGWNDGYNSDVGSWQRIVQNDATLYGYSDFNRLFQSET